MSSRDQSTSRPPLYSQIDVSQATYNSPATVRAYDGEHTRLLHALLAGQDRQNELLEELINQLSASQKQRSTELVQWKQANPRLARNCRIATEALSKVQVEFLDSLTQEIHENSETLIDGDFMLNEFIDRFGPRMAHLNGLLQVLSQLSAVPNPTDSPDSSS